MTIASMREKRFMGIVIDCLFGARVDGYLAAAAVQKAISLHALPLEDFEDCLQQGIAQIKCGKISYRILKNLIGLLCIDWGNFHSNIYTKISTDKRGVGQLYSIGAVNTPIDSLFTWWLCDVLPILPKIPMHWVEYLETYSDMCHRLRLCCKECRLSRLQMEIQNEAGMLWYIRICQIAAQLLLWKENSDVKNAHQGLKNR